MTALPDQPAAPAPRSSASSAQGSPDQPADARTSQGRPAWPGRPVVGGRLLDLCPDTDDGMLSIHVHRQEASTARTRGGQRRSELRYGSPTRRLPLPRGATADVVSASYRDGILEVRLPAPGDHARRVPVART